MALEHALQMIRVSDVRSPAFRAGFEQVVAHLSLTDQETARAALDEAIAGSEWSRATHDHMAPGSSGWSKADV